MSNSKSPGLPPELALDGRIATITLRRPEVGNRLELEDLALLREQLCLVNDRKEVLVLRLRGQGRHFCSGFNLAQAASEGAVATAGASFEALASEIERVRPVTIAAINGGFHGGATDLALACDFRIGVTGARMFVPAAQIGLVFYRGGLERYVRRLGLGPAKRVLLAAEELDARQMLDCGFLDEVVEPEALEAAVTALSERLAGMAPLALLPMKRHLDAIAAGTLDAATLARDIARADASQDQREGVAARLQKRPPEFHGH
ncbi:enoyl-CoA hydratase/isomerase family protein [Caldimonas tepidiphila]|uniref:enoyl-CoA hydratase/isomerase family protein n=1 Tax=Caldimonas tepidiphila TaxID=2315841 RepID=UPI001F0C6008|nr:enoyl-CoA hydratase/isomerase family protein [Caldimonas tepidiphila]